MWDITRLNALDRFLHDRFEIVKAVWELKATHGKRLHVPEQWGIVLDAAKKLWEEKNIAPEITQDIWETIHMVALKIEANIMLEWDVIHDEKKYTAEIQKLRREILLLNEKILNELAPVIAWDTQDSAIKEIQNSILKHSPDGIDYDNNALQKLIQEHEELKDIASRKRGDLPKSARILKFTWGKNKIAYPVIWGCRYSLYVDKEDRIPITVLEWKGDFNDWSLTQIVLFDRELFFLVNQRGKMKSPRGKYINEQWEEQFYETPTKKPSVCHHISNLIHR